MMKICSSTRANIKRGIRRREKEKFLESDFHKLTRCRIELFGINQLMARLNSFHTTVVMNIDEKFMNSAFPLIFAICLNRNVKKSRRFPSS